MTTFEEMPSVKTAVDREAQRRKRVFATFLALLLIPIAIGAYAIAMAPSETDAVVNKVTPLVQERVEKNVEETITTRVDRTVEPRVAEIVERRATPVIERTLDRQLNAAMTARVQPLEQNYRALVARNTEHDKTSARVQELERRVAMLERRLAVLTNQRDPKIDPAIKIDPTRGVPKPQ
jgi:polyhydroxyalkanoate synthesis regulator phasin